MERKVSQKKRLVGNDVVSLSRQKPKPVKKPTKQPKTISEITIPKRKQPPVKTVSPEKTKIEQSSSATSSKPISDTQVVNIEQPQRPFNQALVNAIAYDTLVIVVLAYIGFISKWLLWFIIGYAIIVLIFRFSSRRMFISAALSLVMLIILKFLRRNLLETAFLDLTLFYIIIGSIRLGIEYIQK